MQSPDGEPGSSSETTGGGPPLRVVTAASLFDGHDAAITLIRRLLQDRGVEVVHLGHNRSVADVVRAVLQEDADAVAVSSYQGGHLEYFGYLVSELAERGAGHVRVFGGGGGTITREEIATLHATGVEQVYHPDDGLRLGLDGMISDLITRTMAHRRASTPAQELPAPTDDLGVAELLSAIEDGVGGVPQVGRTPPEADLAPVIGVTGTGGAGKSSVIDELLIRFLTSFEDLRVAVLAVDPSRRRTGGALLGDRIRMNSLRSGRIFMRSFATRRRDASLSDVLAACVQAVRAVGFDLVVVETAGIGQADSAVVELVDVPVYVMTSEYGAATQLEKIEMLDFADLIIMNKAERRGSADALRDVRKQWRRNRLAFDVPDEQVPVYPTVASQFHDPGVTAAFEALCAALPGSWEPGPSTGDRPSGGAAVIATIPPERTRYLAEIAAHGRALNERIDTDCETADLAQSLWRAMQSLADPALPAQWQPIGDGTRQPPDATAASLRERYTAALDDLAPDSLTLLREWPERASALASETGRYTVREREIAVENRRATLSGTLMPRVAAPTYRSAGDLLRFLHRENLPGGFPYTGGVYPYRRGEEHPTRMFAGEGPPERTNRRFHYLRQGAVARLSTAFDSVTLYGEDPATRPDVYGKVGNSGVSVPTLDDMKRLYSGFDLCVPPPPRSR